MDLAEVRLSLLALLLSSAPAAAHPIDEVVQGAYVMLLPNEIRLELDITPGRDVAAAVLRALDANGDGQITDDESHAYAARVLEQSELVLDGASIGWSLLHVSVPPYQNVARESDTIKIYAVAARAELDGSRSFRYANRYAPATSECIANVFAQPDASWRYAIIEQHHSNDGRQLDVTYTASRAK